MNMMILSEDHKQNARVLADAHVHKLGLEAMQVFCTAAREMRVPFDSHWRFAPFLPLPKSTHEAHPLVEWALEDRAHMGALLDYADACFSEYTERFQREYPMHALVLEARNWLWAEHAHTRPKVWCPCIPEEYRQEEILPKRAPIDVVGPWYLAYLQAKYRTWGARARWSNRLPPVWAQESKRVLRKIVKEKPPICVRVVYTLEDVDLLELDETTTEDAAR